MDKKICITGEISGSVTFNIYTNSPEKDETVVASPESKRRKTTFGTERQTGLSHKFQGTPADSGATSLVSYTDRKDDDEEMKQLKALYEYHKNNPDYFQMTIRPKGIVLIINNFNLDKSDIETRRGSDKDCKSLLRAFTHIGIPRRDIEEKHDLTGEEIMTKVGRLAHSRRKASFYAIFITTHGTSEDGKSVVTGTDGVRVSAKEIVDQFRVPHLKEIPILFFFQACRGGKDENAGLQSPHRCDEDHYNETIASDGHYDDDMDEDELDYVAKALPDGNIIGDVPVYKKDSDALQLGGASASSPTAAPSVDYVADEDLREFVRDHYNVMVFHGTADGYTSLRGEVTGTPFIQEICTQLCSPAAKTQDLISLMQSIHNSLYHKRFPGRRFRGAARTAHTFGTKKLFLFPGL